MNCLKIPVLTLLVSALPLAAQETKTVTVSAAAPYVETLDVPCDERGLSLTVRICYDEAQDVLSLSLAPGRPVILFRSDMRYRDIFGCGRTLQPRKFTYRALSYPGAKYKLSGTVYRQYAPPRDMHLYNRWIGDISQSLELLPSASSEDSGAVQMVTSDSLLLRFKVKSSADRVSFRIRNVLALETVRQNPKTGREVVNITGEKDLNTTFDVTIHRDPCYGTSALLDSLVRDVMSVKEACTRLRASCPDGVVLTEEEAGIFREHRMLLLSRFPVRENRSRCPSAGELYAKYNGYVDSIRTMPCKLDLRSREVEEFFADQDRLSTGVIVSSARKLNDMALRLMTSSDALEKADIADTGDELIRSIHRMAGERGVVGDDKDEAVRVFSEAEAFFRSVVTKTR